MKMFDDNKGERKIWYPLYILSGCGPTYLDVQRVKHGNLLEKLRRFYPSIKVSLASPFSYPLFYSWPLFSCLSQ